MARVLAREMERRPDVASVVVLDDFRMLGRALGGYLAKSFELHLGRLEWSYDLAYRAFARASAGRRIGEHALYALGASALLASIEAQHPDVVVSTYPVMNPILGGLRARGRLACPVGAIVGPLAGLAYWVHPGIDLHMLNYPEAAAEVERLGGGASAVPVRPLVSPEFFEYTHGEEVAKELRLGPGRRMVLISGGGWGAGDLAGAVEECLEVDDQLEVVAVAGRNEALRARLAERFGRCKRVRVLGFTKRMHDLLACADAFVSTTAGTSCIEARLCGCPTVCYGFTIGHVRDNTAALERLGLARMARKRAELARAISQALTEGRHEQPHARDLPSAAELAAALAHQCSASGAPL